MKKPLAKKDPFAAIEKLAKQTNEIALRAVSLYAAEVENIITTKCKNNKTIEHTLDGMLSFCFNEQMLLHFKTLCRYYFTINPTATVDYINIYREQWDSEE